MRLTSPPDFPIWPNPARSWWVPRRIGGLKGPSPLRPWDPSISQARQPPIPAYRVLSAKERPTLYLPGRMISSEMVGRNQELNLLKL